MALTEMVIMPGEDYQAICDSVRAKTGGTELLKSGEVAPAIDGIEANTGIDTSDGTAEENDIAYGKVAYVNEERIEGTIPVERYIDTNAYSWWDSNNKRFNLYSFPEERVIIGTQYQDGEYISNDFVDLYCPGSRLGNATVNDVREGVTFTSENGLKITGIMTSNSNSGSNSTNPYSKVDSFTWTPGTNVTLSSVPTLSHSLGVKPDGYFIVSENFGDDWESSSAGIIGCIGTDTLVNDGYYRPFGYARTSTSQVRISGTIGRYSSTEIFKTDQIVIRADPGTAYFKAGKTYKVVIYKW